MQLLSRLPGQYQASGVLTLVKSEHWSKGIKQKKVGVSSVREQSWLRMGEASQKTPGWYWRPLGFSKTNFTWASIGYRPAVLRAFLPTTRKLSCRLFQQYPRLFLRGSY